MCHPMAQITATFEEKKRVLVSTCIFSSLPKKNTVQYQREGRKGKVSNHNANKKGVGLDWIIGVKANIINT